MLTGLDVVAPVVAGTDQADAAVTALQHPFGKDKAAVGAHIAECVETALHVPDRDSLTIHDEPHDLAGGGGRYALGGHRRKYAGNHVTGDKAVPVRHDHGRTAELAALEAALERARSGSGQAVLLVGEAGVGTSHLVETFLDAHRDDDLFVVDLTAQHGPDATPMTALARLAETVAGRHDSAAVDASAAALARAVASNDKAREVVRLLDETVQLVSMHSLLILVLDDARNASAALLDAVVHVARRSRDRAVLTIVATRPDDDRLDTVLARTDALVVPVDPFDAATAAEFVAALTAGGGHQGLPSATVRDVVERSGGNPRYLIELVAAHAVEGAGESAPVPTLGLLVLRRIKRLSPRALAVARAAAIARKAPTPRLCALVCGLDPDDVTPVTELTAAEVISVVADQISFPNPAVREVVLASTPQAVLRDLHGAMAELLTLMGEPATAVAPHALAAAIPGDPSAKEVVRLATEAAVTVVDAGSPDAALDLIERAVRLGPSPDGESLLRTVEGEALLHLGRVDEAALTFERAIALGAGEDALLGLARALQRGGELTAALDVFERCSGLGAVRGRAEVLLGLGRVADARDAAATAVAHARRTEEHAALASALADQALVEAVANGPTAVKHAAASVREWRRAGEDALDWPPLFSLGLALETDDRFDECLDTLAELRAWLDVRGLLDQVPRCVRTEVTAGFLGCRWARMEEAIAAAADVRRDEPNHEMGPIWASYAALAAARGEEVGWDHGLARSREALAAQSTPFDRALAAWWRAVGHTLRLELREAHAAGLEAVDGATKLGAANLMARAIPGVAVLSGVLGRRHPGDLGRLYEDACADTNLASRSAGEVLVAGFASTSTAEGRAVMVDAARHYANSENRLAVVMSVACATLVPGHDPVPEDLAVEAARAASSLDMDCALTRPLMTPALRHTRSHLP